MIIIYKKIIILFSFIFLLFLITGLNNTILAEEKQEIKQMDWQRLEEESRKIFREDPENIIAGYELALALANQGKVEESYEQFGVLGDMENQEQHKYIIDKQALQVKEENEILALNYLAFRAVVDENYNDSKKYFYQIIELEPENVWIYNYLAASYIELEEYEQAFDILDKALDIKDNAYSHLLYGYIYWEQGRYFRAISAFTRSGRLSDIISEIF